MNDSEEEEEWKEDVHVMSLKQKRNHKDEPIAKLLSKTQDGSSEASQKAITMKQQPTTSELSQDHDANLVTEVTLHETENVWKEDTSSGKKSDELITQNYEMVNDTTMMDRYQHSISPSSMDPDTPCKIVAPQFSFTSFRIYQYYQILCHRLGVEPIDKIVYQITRANRINDILSYFDLRGIYSQEYKNENCVL
jgi:hypothetical protein